MPADNFVEMIRFFTTLILNADESRKIVTCIIEIDDPCAHKRYCLLRLAVDP